MTRVAMMLADNPDYEDKYKWFLDLYESVLANDQLVPEDVLRSIDYIRAQIVINPS
jgi:hypothetical protein